MVGSSLVMGKVQSRGFTGRNIAFVDEGKRDDGLAG